MKKIFTLFAALAMVMSMSAKPYLRGSFNGWGTDNEFTDGVCEITLAGGTTYEFKVDANGDWGTSYGNNGTMKSDNCTGWIMSSSAGNCKITTTIAGVYKFTWVEASKKLSVTYPTEAVEVEYTYTVVGSSASLFGTTWDVSNTANDMTKEGDVYTLTKTDITLAAGEVQYKVAREHAWGTGEYPTSGNAILTIETAGVYDVTFTYDGGTKLTATPTLKQAEEVIPTVSVKGAWDEWTLKTLVLADDKLTATATVNIATVGTYQFGVDIDGVFTANGATVSRESNTVAGLTGNTGDLKLTVDVAGDYVFTWTYETNTLVVTYPELPTPTYDVTVTEATVSTVGQNIVLSGSWEEKALTVMLWQGGATQGFGTYAVEDYSPITLGTTELTATSEGVYADNGDGTFAFTATATDADGAIYNISVTGAIPATVEPETVEIEATAEFADNGEGSLYIDVCEENWAWCVQLTVWDCDGSAGEYEISGLYSTDNDYNVSGTATIAYDEYAETDVLTATLKTADESLTVLVTLYKKATEEEPKTITWELNGGELVVEVPTQDSLIAAFKDGYNAYFGVNVATTRTIDNFLYAGAAVNNPTCDVSLFMKDDASPWKWLGDYVLAVTNAQIETGTLSTLKELATELMWRQSLTGFFLQQAKLDSNYKGNADFTEAGKPEAWGAAYQAAHVVVLPTEPVAEDYVLPTPVKSGYTFVGWYDNADGTGEALTVLKAGWAGTLYAIWKQDTTTTLENITVEGKAVKAIINGQLIIIKNGVQYNAQGAVVK